jgi:DNA processing protein
MTDDVRRAWAYLSRVAEPPCPELAALARRVGPIEAAERVKRGDVGDDLARRTEARRRIDCAADDLDLLTRLGGRLVTAADDEWPLLSLAAFGGVNARKRPQAHSPMVLWAVGPGRLDEVAERAAAVVGTRASTTYGEHVAAELGADLAGRDVAVVSGGAYGIDGAAHRAALSADGFTVAVLAGGVDVSYPAGHAALLRRIAELGLLVSEYPPGVRPARHRFLTRNRLVAALAGATVVVEAGARSGAANTAAWARALGRGVCAVPGPVTSNRGTPPRWTACPKTSSGSTTRCRPAARAPPIKSPWRPGCRPPRCSGRCRCWRSPGWWSVRTDAGNWPSGRLTPCTTG